MKKISLAIALLFVLSTATAQIENIKLAKDSTILINDVYAGILAGSCFSQNSLNFSKFSSFRAGGKATYSPTNWLSAVSTASYQIDDRGQVSTINQFWFKLKLKAISAEAGFLPTLATESRPVPVTADGQFETWTEASLPGAALGAKIKYNFNNNKNYIGIGVSQMNKEPEYHLRYSSTLIKASIYYSEFNQKFGSSIAIKTKKLYDIMAFNAGQTIGNLICYKLDTKNQIDYYCDFGYGLKEKKVLRFESGLLKNFSGNYLKGLFGISYCNEIKSVKGYLFIHI